MIELPKKIKNKWLRKTLAMRFGSICVGRV
jgi:hypothetical protein